jgi:hypothetical protein
VREVGLSPVLITEDDLIKKRPVAANTKAATHSASTQTPAVANLQQLSQADSTGELTVPELAGLSLREVLTRVGAAPVNLNVKGEGFVSQTIPAAGTKLAAGHSLTVILSTK